MVELANSLQNQSSARRKNQWSNWKRWILCRDALHRLQQKIENKSCKSFQLKTYFSNSELLFTKMWNRNPVWSFLGRLFSLFRFGFHFHSGFPDKVKIWNYPLSQTELLRETIWTFDIIWAFVLWIPVTSFSSN